MQPWTTLIDTRELIEDYTNELPPQRRRAMKSWYIYGRRYWLSGITIVLAFMTMGICKQVPIPNLKRISLPIALKYNGVNLNYLVCNQAMEIPLTNALQCVKMNGIDSLETAGCTCYRYVRGTTKLSKHASGMAIDINPFKSIDPVVVDCFKQAGFNWGGDWTIPDLMHFELETP